MRVSLCAPLIILAAITSASARLGETLEQCATRYGGHITEDKDETGKMMSRTYRKAGYQILVIFRLSGGPTNFVACGVSYTKPTPIGNASLNGEEIDRFLDVNAMGQRWVHQESPGFSQATDRDEREHGTEDLVEETWIRSDKRATANYNRIQNIFSVLTVELLEYLDRDQKSRLKEF
jgi:hypothetical protein